MSMSDCEACGMTHDHHGLCGGCLGIVDARPSRWVPRGCMKIWNETEIIIPTFEVASNPTIKMSEVRKYIARHHGLMVVENEREEE